MKYFDSLFYPRLLNSRPNFTGTKVLGLSAFIYPSTVVPAVHSKSSFATLCPGFPLTSGIPSAVVLLSAFIGRSLLFFRILRKTLSGLAFTLTGLAFIPTGLAFIPTGLAFTNRVALLQPHKTNSRKIIPSCRSIIIPACCRINIVAKAVSNIPQIISTGKYFKLVMLFDNFFKAQPDA